jgi:hypothetical protein
MERNAVKKIFASAARTATVSSDVISNPGHNSAYIVVDATVEAATASVVPTLQAYDPISGKYFTIATMAAIEAVGTYVYLVGTSQAATDGAGVTSVHDLPLPRYWRLTMTHADADALTYSAAALYTTGY